MELFATGWQPAEIGLFESSLRAKLGLPVSPTYFSYEEKTHWERLDAEADNKVLEMYPIFADPPKGYPNREERATPWRLLLGSFAPEFANQRNIIFLGQVSNGQTASMAEINSLWGIAYLERLLPNNNLLENQEAIDRRIALTNAFMRRRYPGRKNQPVAVFESRDWMDYMLKQLGVRTDRNRLAWKRNHGDEFGWWGWKSWVREWFEPYEPEVYQGIVQEFLDTVRHKEDRNKKTR
jgi:dimethylaniline monooxygenase (N-oxide forming)